MPFLAASVRARATSPGSIGMETVEATLVRRRARSSTLDSVVVRPAAIASSIQRAVSFRCWYHHSASSASDRNFGISGFLIMSSSLQVAFLQPQGGRVGRNGADGLAREAEHHDKNAPGAGHPERFGALLPFKELNFQQRGVPVENRLLDFSGRNAVSCDVVA